MQKPLPALRPGRVTEGGLIVPVAQLVATGLQLDTPAERQFRSRGQLPSTIAPSSKPGRLPVPLGHKSLVQALEPLGADQAGGGKRGLGSHNHRPFGINNAFHRLASVSMAARGHGRWFMIWGPFVPSRSAARG